MNPTPAVILERIRESSGITLFLDYDGTLAEFAPTPDDVIPNPNVIRLIDALVHTPELQVAVISGRRLQHIERLVPVAGCLLAGTYGIEYITPQGERVEQVHYDEIRPQLENLKHAWEAILAEMDSQTVGRLYLEDKGWAIAIHASRVRAELAAQVITHARQLALEMLPSQQFRILGGHQFLEAGPKNAHKGKTIQHLIEDTDLLNKNNHDLYIYLGDDDKDEEAFEVIHEMGGLAILVSPEPRRSRADFRLDSPADARLWLAECFLNGGKQK